MPTPVAPIGAPFGPRTNESAGSLTRTCAPRLRRAERPRSGLVLGLLRVGIQLALAGDASAPGQISDGGCVSRDGCNGLCAPANGSSLKGATSATVSPDGASTDVAAFTAGAVAVLNRIPTGQPSYAGRVSNDGSGGPSADVPGSPLLALKPVVASHHTTTFGIVD
jgi:hypothetical protein